LRMWHSLEVRVPLVDHPLVELSARLPSRFKLDWRSKKILLKRLARRRLPGEVIAHRKQGFESPMGAWMRGELRGYTTDVLSGPRLSETGLFNTSYVSAKLSEHVAGRSKNNKLLFSLIMFQHWFERYMK
jgi:asparagine synthase (glutamine-hydrolysing)